MWCMLTPLCLLSFPTLSCLSLWPLFGCCRDREEARSCCCTSSSFPGTSSWIISVRMKWGQRHASHVPILSSPYQHPIEDSLADLLPERHQSGTHVLTQGRWSGFSSASPLSPQYPPPSAATSVAVTNDPKHPWEYTPGHRMPAWAQRQEQYPGRLANSRAARLCFVLKSLWQPCPNNPVWQKMQTTLRTGGLKKCLSFPEGERFGVWAAMN